MSGHEGKEEHKNGRWSPVNHPVGYILGVSPGFSQMAQGEERLINMGLARKIVKAARLGFDFTEIDYEALSEMYEPDVEKLIKHVKEIQRMEVGIHLPVKVDLCIANAFEWKEMHEILRKGAYSAREIVGAKFFLFHTSSRIRPHVTFTVGHQEPAVQQNSFNGQNLGEWIDDVDKGKFKDPKTGKIIKLPMGKSLRQWFKARHTKVLFHVMGLAGDVGMLTFLERHGDFIHGAEAAGNALGILRDDIWLKKVKGIMLEKYTKEHNDAQNIMRALEEYARKILSSRYSGFELESAIREYLRSDIKYNNAINRSNAFKSIVDEINRVKHEKELSFDYQQDREKEELMAQWLNDGVRPEEALGKLSPMYKKHQTYHQVMYYVQHTDFDKVFDFWKTKGSECEEQIAYRTIAKFMFLIKDSIWVDIVGEKYDPDIIIKCADMGYPNYDEHIFEKSDSDEETGHEIHPAEHKSHDEKKTNIEELVEKMITAVACKYIEGHLYVSGDIWGMAAEFPELHHLKDESVYKYAKDGKMMIFIETSMPPEGQEGELRIMSAHDHVTLVKHLDKGDITAYTMDFEHLTVNFVKVGLDIESLKDGDAKYIKMMHINAPRPIIGAHAPVPLMSHDMFIIYRWLFELRKKGMANAYFIWEMGGFGIDQSAIAFRNMVQELAKDTDPKKLPARFYGLDETLWAAQHVAIRNHGLDPLKGMIMVPEIDHGVFSKAAHEKGKAKEWDEEKYKY